MYFKRIIFEEGIFFCDCEKGSAMVPMHENTESMLIVLTKSHGYRMDKKVVVTAVI